MAIRTGMVQVFDGTAGRGLDHIIDYATHIEALGFDSLWAPDHVIFFDTYSSKYPHTDDGSIDFKKDQGILEPLMVLQAAAHVTEHIRLGTSVEIITERNPVVRAREIATLDVISGGRFNYAVGIGWSKEEYKAIGVPWARRGARADEYIHVMRALWREYRPSFHGEFVDFPEVVFFPKPVQAGGVPILVGGNSDAALQRIARCGDGWQGWKLTISEVEERLARLREIVEEAGRPWNEITCNVGIPFKGDLNELAEYREALDKIGVHELVIAAGISRTRFKDQLSEFAEVLGLPARTTTPRGETR